MARILILGGGFGGLAAANVLRRRLSSDDEIILIDRRERFVMGFAKLWDLAGVRALEDGTRSLTGLARRGIRAVTAEITAVEPGDLHVDTTAGGFDADAMVIALGAAPSPRHREMLAADSAYDLYDVDALPAIRAALASVTRGRVVVAILGGPFKCPPAPYEAALIVDELLRARDLRDEVEVVLTTPQPMTLPAAGVDASAYIADHLHARDIGLLPRHRVVALDAGRRTVVFADEAAELPYDVLLGVPADVLPEVLHTSGLAGASGWIEPDPRELTTAAERVYAVGDCTVIPTAAAQLPHAGVFAAAQGEVAARNIVADLTGAARSTFDGHGFCFLELPGEQVAFIEGDFYADPLAVTLSAPDHAQFLRKQAYERDRLSDWLS